MIRTRDGIAKAWRTILDRCDTLKLPVWRANAAGMIISEPEIEGLIGLWLSASPMARRIALSCAEIDPARPSELVEVDTGCWLLPLPETRRRRVHGYTLALALSPEVCNSRLFDEVCASARIDRAAMRAAMREWAIYDHVSASRTLRTMVWMHEDRREIASGESSMEGFVERLTESYETIDLLYALGHEMNQPGEPEQFIRFTLARLIDGTAFKWIGALVSREARGLDTIRDHFFFAGEPTMSGEALEQACRALVKRQRFTGDVAVLSDVDGFEPLGGPQVAALPVMREGREVAWLLAGEKTGADPQISSYDTHLLEAASGHLGPFLENASLYQDQRMLFMGTLTALSAAIDAKDPYTQGHSERVAHLSAELAKAAGLDDAEVERVRIAGLVHDVGKIGVAESVLRKPGRLDDSEFDAIKEHPEIGHRILKGISQLDDVLPGVLHHHERWDGNGYPHRIAGEAIPMIARIIAVADTFDAMSSNRAYRSGMDRSAVIAEIERCGGSQFDPELAKIFPTLDLREYDSMVASAKSQDPAYQPQAETKPMDRAA